MKIYPYRHGMAAFAPMLIAGVPDDVYHGGGIYTSARKSRSRRSSAYCRRPLRRHSVTTTTIRSRTAARSTKAAPHIVSCWVWASRSQSAPPSTCRPSGR